MPFPYLFDLDSDLEGQCYTPVWHSCHTGCCVLCELCKHYCCTKTVDSNNNHTNMITKHWHQSHIDTCTWKLQVLIRKTCSPTQAFWKIKGSNSNHTQSVWNCLELCGIHLAFLFLQNQGSNSRFTKPMQNCQWSVQVGLNSSSIEDQLEMKCETGTEILGDMHPSWLEAQHQHIIQPNKMRCRHYYRWKCDCYYICSHRSKHRWLLIQAEQKRPTHPAPQKYSPVARAGDVKTTWNIVAM